MIVEAEMVLLINTTASDRLAIPVSMPWAGTFVHHGTYADHLAMDISRRHQSCTTDGCHWCHQHRQLCIFRTAVLIAKLIIHIISLVRQLMSVETLHGNSIAIVNHNLISRLQLFERIFMLAVVLRMEFQHIPIYTANIDFLSCTCTI